MTVPESCRSSVFNPDKTVSTTPVFTIDQVCVCNTGGVPFSQVRNCDQNHGCATSPETDTSPVPSWISPVKVTSGIFISPLNSINGTSTSHVRTILGTSTSPVTGTSGVSTLPLKSDVHHSGQANLVDQL